MIWACMLLVIGAALVVAEVFLPSFGLFTLLAGGAILGADALAFREGGNAVGWAFILIEVIGLPLLVMKSLKWLPKTRLGQRIILTAPTEEPEPGLPDYRPLVGAEGMATSDLRPSGMARFGERRISVVAATGHLPEGTPLSVIAVEGPEIRVIATAPAHEPNLETTS